MEIWNHKNRLVYDLNNSKITQLISSTYGTTQLNNKTTSIQNNEKKFSLDFLFSSLYLFV